MEIEQNRYYPIVIAESSRDTVIIQDRDSIIIQPENIPAFIEAVKKASGVEICPFCKESSLKNKTELKLHLLHKCPIF